MLKMNENNLVCWQHMQLYCQPLSIGDGSRERHYNVNKKWKISKKKTRPTNHFFFSIFTDFFCLFERLFFKFLNFLAKKKLNRF